MSSRSHLFVSVLLVLLLLSSVTVPVAAEPVPALASLIAAAPGSSSLFVGGIEFVLSGGAAVAIGAELGKNWDGVIKNFDNFASDVGKAIDGVFSVKWVEATSDERKMMTQVEAQLFAAVGGGKKPDEDKWYHEAKLENGKVKVNTKRISLEKAVQRLKEGKDVFTLNKDLGNNAAIKATKEGLQGKIKPSEIHEGGKPGYYPHYHPEIPGKHPHIWWDGVL